MNPSDLVGAEGPAPQRMRVVAAHAPLGPPWSQVSMLQGHQGSRCGCGAGSRLSPSDFCPELSTGTSGPVGPQQTLPSLPHGPRWLAGFLLPQFPHCHHGTETSFPRLCPVRLPNQTTHSTAHSQASPTPSALPRRRSLSLHRTSPGVPRGFCVGLKGSDTNKNHTLNEPVALSPLDPNRPVCSGFALCCFHNTAIFEQFRPVVLYI